jgi:hypothetical protein
MLFGFSGQNSNSILVIVQPQCIDSIQQISSVFKYGYIETVFYKYSRSLPQYFVQHIHSSHTQICNLLRRTRHIACHQRNQGRTHTRPVLCNTDPDPLLALAANFCNLA